MITIYFDTSFLINLGEARVTEAAEAVEALNHHQVRYVKSSVLFGELARSPNQAENHARILNRLSGLSVAPLELGDDDWSALTPGPQREALGSLMRSLDEVDVYVRAVCSAANHSNEYQRFLGAMFETDAAAFVDLIHRQEPDLLVRVHNTVLRRENPDILARIGEVRPSGDLDMNQIRIIRHQAWMTRLALEDAGVETPRLPEFESMRPVEASVALLEWMADVFGDEVVRRSAHRHELDADTTHGDDRGLRLMENSISARSRARFSSSLRDCGHMAIFASFAGAIDFLQVDGPKLNEIQHRADHYINQLGLGNRCFAASTLGSVVASVQLLAEGKIR